MQDFLTNQILTREAKLGLDVATGKKAPDEAAVDYGTGELINFGVNSGADALHGAKEGAENASNGISLDKPQDPLGNASQEQLYSDAVNIPTTEQYPQPTIASSGLQDSGIVGQGGQVKLGNNALNPTMPQQGIDITNSQPTGVQLNDNAYQNISNPSGSTNPLPDYGFEGYNGDVTSPANKTVEKPGTFLGLEGKDYTKMGMQGVLAAGVGMATQPPVQSKAPPAPGMTKGKMIPQGGMQGVNSMTQPATPPQKLNSMQMTQAQGLLNPFQRDRYRRGQY